MTAAIRRRLFFLTVLAGAVVFVFYPGLFDGGVFVYRDAAHFYYPLFEFIQSEWDAGRIPLWNPYENFGTPLVAGASSSVFYPGKLIFFSPLSYAWNFRLYTIGHIVLAACGVAVLARRWKRSLIAATLSGISYAFCGSVLMQYCNVIFLVGAAWLPFAVLAAERMLVRRTPSHAAVFGTILALMTLGGDPQMAYNAGLVAVFYAVLLWRRPHAPVATPLAPLRWWRRRPALLALAACVAFILAAIQVFPTVRYLRSTARAGTSFSQRLRCDFAGSDDGHLNNAYEFSVGPWRFAELLWPNFGGRQYPVNRRWMEAIPAEGRVWTPTLYMGILPFALAVWGLRFFRGNRRLRWMSWLAVLAAVAALGWYGIGWIVHEISLACGADQGKWLFPAPVGGLYWLMTLILPGYAAFRYPAKLLVVAALGASIVAAFGWDRQRIARSAGFVRLLGGITVASLLGLVGYAAIRPWWDGWMHHAAPNALFGPLDAEAAANDMLWGLCQTAVVSAVSLLLLRGIRRGHAVCAVLIVLLTLADLVVANRWIVAFGPRGLREAPSAGAVAIRAASQPGEEYTPFPRVYRRRRWLPESFRKTSSEERLVEVFRWDCDSLYPKFPLPGRIGMLGVQGTIIPRPVAGYLDELNRQSASDDVSFSEPLPAEFALLPGNRRVEGAERIATELEDIGLWRVSRSRPWIGVLADPADPAGEVLSPPACDVISFTPGRVIVEVTVDRPETLALSGFDDPDWQAWIESEEGRVATPLLQLTEGSRGLSVSEGKQRIVLQYTPRAFYAGALISVAGWVILAFFAGWTCRKRVLAWAK